MFACNIRANAESVGFAASSNKQPPVTLRRYKNNVFDALAADRCLRSSRPMLSNALGTLLQQKATRELLSNRTRRLPLSSRCLKKGFALLNTTWTGSAHTHIHVVFLDWTLSPWHPERMLHVPAAESARLKVCERDKLLRGVCSESTPGLCSEISM